MVRLNLPADHPLDEEEIQIVAQTISGATERLAIWRTRNDNTPSPEKPATTLQNLLWHGLNPPRLTSGPPHSQTAPNRPLVPAA